MKKNTKIWLSTKNKLIKLFKINFDLQVSNVKFCDFFVPIKLVFKCQIIYKNNNKFYV